MARRTKGDQAREIANAVIEFLNSRGYFQVARQLADERTREDLEDEIFRAA